MQENEGLEIAEFILPNGILEYFEINKIEQTPSNHRYYQFTNNDGKGLLIHATGKANHALSGAAVS